MFNYGPSPGRWPLLATLESSAAAALANGARARTRLSAVLDATYNHVVYERY
jgi:hypothetical protein